MLTGDRTRAWTLAAILLLAIGVLAVLPGSASADDIADRVAAADATAPGCESEVLAKDTPEPALPASPEPYVTERIDRPSPRVPGLSKAFYNVRHPVAAGTDGKQRPLLVQIAASEDGEANPDSGYPDAAEAKDWIWAGVSINHDNYGKYVGWATQLHIIEVTEELIAKYDVDPSRVYIMGSSKGSVAASTLAFLYPDLFAGLIANATIADQITRSQFGVDLAGGDPAFRASNPIPVMGAFPTAIPFSYDEASPTQLMADPPPRLPQIDTAYPEYAKPPVDPSTRTAVNAADTPVWLAAGGQDTTVPPLAGSVPFYEELCALGYSAHYDYFPAAGHSVPSSGRGELAIRALNYMDAHPRPSTPHPVSYQSADLVNPERSGDFAWPYYDPAGSNQSAPLQAARHDRAGGLVLGDPWLYRVRIAFRSDGPARWDGGVSLDGGRIISAGGEDDGVGLDGRNTDLSGSTARATFPRRDWLEPGENARLKKEGEVSFKSGTNGSAGDGWDMVTLEIGADPTAKLELTSKALGKKPKRIRLASIRRSIIAGGQGDQLVRTLDLPASGGTVRLQVLQPHSDWWSRATVTPAPGGNSARLEVSNLATSQLDLERLGLDASRKLKLKVTGADTSTGRHTVTLEGVTGQRTVELNGRELKRDRYAKTADGLQVQLGSVAGKTKKLTVRPGR